MSGSGWNEEPSLAAEIDCKPGEAGNNVNLRRLWRQMEQQRLRMDMWKVETQKEMNKTSYRVQVVLTEALVRMIEVISKAIDMI